MGGLFHGPALARGGMSLGSASKAREELVANI